MKKKSQTQKRLLVVKEKIMPLSNDQSEIIRGGELLPVKGEAITVRTVKTSSAACTGTLTIN